MALAVSLEHFGTTNNNPKAIVLAETLDKATDMFLDHKKSPSRKVGELDNRGATFYLTMYWAQALAAQDADPVIAERFGVVADQLVANEQRIIDEMNASQGSAQDLGGYYKGDVDLLTDAMCPSKTFNQILESI